MGQCTNPCLFRYTWPGRDESFICIEHAHQLNNIASSMGLALQFIQYQPNSDTFEWPTCQQEVSNGPNLLQSEKA